MLLEPQAPAFFMEKRIERRKSRDTGSTVKAQAPTLGRHQGSWRGSPLLWISLATRGPSPSKHSFSALGVASGTALGEDFLPSMTRRILRNMVVGPCSFTRLAMSCFISVRMADLTLSRSRKAGSYRAGQEDHVAVPSACRVESETGGAEGLCSLIRCRGAWKSRIGRNRSVKAVHVEVC